MAPTDWTFEQKLQALMALPWSLAVTEDQDNSGLVVRVTEVPDAIATGKNEKELARDLWESLYASIACRLEHGDAIPLPPGHQLPWLAKRPVPRIPIERDEVELGGRQTMHVRTFATPTVVAA